MQGASQNNFKPTAARPNIRPMANQAPMPMPMQTKMNGNNLYQANPQMQAFKPTPSGPRKTGWDKPPVEKFTSATVVKAMNHIAATPKSDKKQELLEDKTLPDPLRRFIVRGYAKCNTEQERDYMKMILRQMVEMARSINQLQTKNWDEVELPKLPREMIKAAQNMPLGQNGFAKKMVSVTPATQVLNVVQKPLTHEEAQKRNERKSRFAPSITTEHKPSNTNRSIFIYSCRK